MSENDAMKLSIWTFALCLATISFGCTHVTVKKNPKDCDKGIRYYRPKPYLFITPDSAPGADSPAVLSATTTVKQKIPFDVNVLNPAAADATDRPLDLQPAAYFTDDKAKEQAAKLKKREEETGMDDKGGLKPLSSPPKVSIQMMYLPDFAEEYSIRLHPGLGIGELNMKLENGWNLTSVGIKTDQQTDEIIKSTADLISSVGSLAGKNFKSGDGTGGITILATNIPFGFYEAVIATDPCGRKQLYGWRYIGFMPFQSCPTTAVGMQTVSCDDPMAIYGLVIDANGVLRFERLIDVKSLDNPEQQAVKAGGGDRKTPMPTTHSAEPRMPLIPLSFLQRR